MANSSVFLPGSAAALVGLTQNPAVTQNPDAASANLSLGRAGQQHVDTVHGQYGSMTHRKAVFFAQASTAAIAIPVNTTTSGSTFCLVNPTGSGVILEPLDFQLDFLLTNAGPSTATVVGFSFVSLATNAASSITKIAIPSAVANTAIGGIAAQVGAAATPTGYVASAITFASPLSVAANWGYAVATFPASWVPTVGGYPIPIVHDFKGGLQLAPGTAMTLVSSTAFGSNTCVPRLSWAEYQV